MFRDMAQSGSVLVWGARGRGFKSRYPDNEESKYSQKPSNLMIWRLFV